MDGVTILKEYVWRDVSSLACIPMLLLSIVLFVILCMITYAFFKDKEPFGILTGGLAIILGIFICYSCYEICMDYITTYTRYVVTIDNSVNFNEFTNRYEIISNDGAMYTVQERE